MIVPPPWLQRYFDDVDHMRLQPLLAWHTADVTAQTGNMPPVHGKEQFSAAFQGFWQLIGGIRHHFLNIWDTGDGTTVCEVLTSYTRLDGQVVTVPAVSLLHRVDPDVEGGIDSLRIFIDLAPVFAPGPAAVAAAIHARGHERDPLTGTTTPPGRSTAASRRAAASGFVGSALEYYDFFLYAQAAALIFPLVFFPADEPQAGIVAAFATFGVGYAARPLGAFVLGHWGDTQGRRNVLVLCMLTMGISTFLVGVLPTYDQVGMLAPALLVALRLVQGFAVGGEISGASAMIIEQAPEGRRGFFGSFTMQGVQAGQVIAAGAFLPLSAILSTEEFRAWGWRVPFLLSALVVAVGYVIRRRVEETAAFRAEVAAGAVLRAPLVAALTESGPDMLRVAAMVLANVIGTLVVTFGTTFATNPGYGAGFSTTQFLVIAICGNVTAVALIPFAGRLSDRIGRRPCMIVGALGSSVLGYPFLYFIAAGDFWLTFLCAMLMWGVIFQGYQAVFAPYYLELFPTRTRVTAAAVAQSVGTLVTAFLPTLFGSLAGPTPAACVLKRTFAPAVLLPSGRTCAAAAEVAQSGVVRTVGTLTLACGVIAAVAAYTARETYRDPLPG